LGVAARRQDPTIPSDEELEADSNARENIDEVITNQLVLFGNIPALQAQNQKLLGIVREMGAKMEAEECEYHETLEKEQGEAVREADVQLRRSTSLMWDNIFRVYKEILTNADFLWDRSGMRTKKTIRHFRCSDDVHGQLYVKGTSQHGLALVAVPWPWVIVLKLVRYTKQDPVDCAVALRLHVA
jgi:hypothetical protein